MKRQRFYKQTEIPASPEAVFAWHEQPGAVEKLTPPWEKVEMVERGENLRIGARVVFKVFIGPIWRKWVAEHLEYEPPKRCSPDGEPAGEETNGKAQNYIGEFAASQATICLVARMGQVRRLGESVESIC